MKDETKQGETPEAPEEPQVDLEAPKVEEVQEDNFDKDRAMNTIKALRAREKELEKEAARLRKFEEVEKERKQAEMTEAERLKARADELEAELKQERQDMLRLKIANRHNLPEALAERLKGDDEETMEADALKLAELLPQTKTNPKVPPTNPPNGQLTESDEQKRERLFGKQGNVFDLNKIKEGGGGVVWVNKE